MSARIFSIPPGQPFLKTLATRLVDGTLVPGFRADGDPLALASVTIYVPTRRAARSLAAAFAETLGSGSAILPMIRQIGETDETDLFQADVPTLTPAMDELERRLHLARLARGWRAMTAGAEMQRLIGGEAELPACAADAVWLACDLGALLDEAETLGVPLAGLGGLAPDRLAAWWQLTLTFLSIVTEAWPAFLAERGLVSEAAAKNAFLRVEAERVRAGSLPGPVVLAGSTATAPATLDLMHAIANRPDGALVLPGLDRDLDDGSRAAITAPSQSAAPGHHQYGLTRILARFAAEPEAVHHLEAEEDPARRAREALLSDALRPARTTAAWAESHHPPHALDGLALIEAADTREEALAVACAMRDALSDPAATCALVTPDRNLARRVVSELSRFGIAANDSAGRPLSSTAPGTLTATLLEVALRPGDPVPLLALLKHPLTRLGLSAGDARRAARALEIIALRGQVGTADVVNLPGIFEAARRRLEEQPRRAARPVRQIRAAERDLAGIAAERLAAALEPLTALRGEAERELPAYARALTQSLEALAMKEDGEPSILYAEEAGASLADLLTRLVRVAPTGFAFPSRELPDVVAALMADVTVKPRGGLSVRAFVWGALEARLQSVDTAILGGLNEGTWPHGTRAGAFLSRLMRQEISLEPPERVIGLAAHDFWMAMGLPRIVLSRARRDEGAPTIASRWLQRLMTLAGDEGARRLRAEGAPYLEAARRLDEIEAGPRAERPQPRPPLEKRPTRLTITDVETLIRDPYALHARYVMRLEPLPELIRDPHAAERGSLFHDILGTFAQRGHDPNAEDAIETLLGIARDAFEAEALPPDVHAVWWPRMETLAEKYVEWERQRSSRVAARHAEISATLEMPLLETTLTGRADRIDVLTDGTSEILDFKTGSGPSLAQARALLAPQLPLEGALAKRGAFKGLDPARRISELAYIRLKERDFYEEPLSSTGGRKGEPVDADALSEEAFEKLERLVARYRQSETPFVSRARPLRAGDFSGAYDHLARAQEWAGAEEEGDGE